ncbi:hypothetical protein SNEBB_004900 [Seison nebaliae]|nr:hypothetical protein SNEBB_004900 [Seison nebaliae]
MGNGSCAYRRWTQNSSKPNGTKENNIILNNRSPLNQHLKHISSEHVAIDIPEKSHLTDVRTSNSIKNRMKTFTYNPSKLHLTDSDDSNTFHPDDNIQEERRNLKQIPFFPDKSVTPSDHRTRVRNRGDGEQTLSQRKDELILRSGELSLSSQRTETNFTSITNNDNDISIGNNLKINGCHDNEKVSKKRDSSTFKIERENNYNSNSKLSAIVTKEKLIKRSDDDNNDNNNDHQTRNHKNIVMGSLSSKAPPAPTSSTSTTNKTKTTAISTPIPSPGNNNNNNKVIPINDTLEKIDVSGKQSKNRRGFSAHTCTDSLEPEFEYEKDNRKKQFEVIPIEETTNEVKEEPILKSNFIYKTKIDRRVTEKYKICALIGKGSFSNVVRATNHITNQSYAIKIMVKNDNTNDVANKEMEILSHIKHRNVVKFVDLIETRDKYYVVLELADGGELFDRIVENGPFDEPRAAKLMKQLLDAIEYLHGQRITHRDIKPENILYKEKSDNSRILLSDFGLASIKDKHSLDVMSTTCGTPEYIAPEVLSQSEYCSKVDCWASGVVCYIVLSGSMPFDDENRKELYRKILRNQYGYPEEFWLGVTETAKQFIDTLLVSNPSDRSTASDALKHEWIVTKGCPIKTKNKDLSRLNSASSSRPSSVKSTNYRVTTQDIKEILKLPEAEHFRRAISRHKL